MESLEDAATEPQTMIINNVPPGSIMMWSGIGNPPEGWVFCNGQNGTPDLTDKFVYGAATPSINKWPTGGGGNGQKKDNTLTLVAENIPKVTETTGHTHPATLLEKNSGHVHGYYTSTMTPTALAGSGINQISPNKADSGSDVGLWHDTNQQNTFFVTGAAQVKVSGTTDSYTVSVGNPTPTPVDITPAYVALAFIMKKYPSNNNN